jgi:hypothetical protein
VNLSVLSVKGLFMRLDDCKACVTRCYELKEMLFVMRYLRVYGTFEVKKT